MERTVGLSGNVDVLGQRGDVGADSRYSLANKRSKHEDNKNEPRVDSQG